MSERSSGLERIPRRKTKDVIVEAAATVIARRGVRGLRVEDVAREAGTSVALPYYYFGDRTGLVRAALNHANEQAPSMLDDESGADGRDARTRLADALLAELDDEGAVRNNSVVWNEVSTSATFDPDLREDLRRVTDAWNAKVARTIRQAQDEGSIAPGVRADDLAEELTCLIEGLSLRWLAGTLALDRARELLGIALARLLPPAR